MPNITITVDDRLYRAARIHAVNRDTTLTEIVRQYLKHLVHQAGDYNFAHMAEGDVTYEQREHLGIFHPQHMHPLPPIPTRICGSVASEAEKTNPTPPPSSQFHCDSEPAS